jgi:hypothetical protein
MTQAHDPIVTLTSVGETSAIAVLTKSIALRFAFGASQPGAISAPQPGAEREIYWVNLARRTMYRGPTELATDPSQTVQVDLDGEQEPVWRLILAIGDAFKYTDLTTTESGAHLVVHVGQEPT